MGVDVTRQPTERVIRFATREDEKQNLIKGIEKVWLIANVHPFTLPDSPRETNAALLAQGSSACIWPEDGQCSSAYQPGLSDYHFELFVPVKLMARARLCVSGSRKPYMFPSLKDADVSVFPGPGQCSDHAYRHVEPSFKTGRVAGAATNTATSVWAAAAISSSGFWKASGLEKAKGDKRVDFNNDLFWTKCSIHSAGRSTRKATLRSPESKTRCRS